ncbi:calpain-13-like isoform X2 [Bombina bombina]|uniref:calpain-13-like isoform X2 n=1 Tax=Bombina bombina TaxID=8345 RepID=UPI00235A61AB|nr:calpain-13-like isoform X2 [Bombina bombina]
MQAPGFNAHPEQQGHGVSGSLQNPKKFRNQDFDILRDYHFKKRILFKDEVFPADISIIGPKLEAEFNLSNIVWKRPWEICKEPRLIMDGASFLDIKQSKLGDCWVLSAMGSVTRNKNLLENILPLNQEFTTKYAGIFHFRFWHFGDWVDVVIDDRLPFVNGEYLSVQPSNGMEFWPCLLEKAYAKLCGAYQQLHWGDPADAFVNFTGGVTMTFELKNPIINQSDIWEMVNAADPSTLMACISEKLKTISRNRSSSVPFANEPNEVRRNSAPNNVNIHLQNGMVETHAYCITDTAQIFFRNKTENLIRLWNPWGKGEWLGRWNDSWPGWKEVSHQERVKLCEKKEDGQFWMSWEDFAREFSVLIICSHYPDFLDWGDQSKKWYRTVFRNIWPEESHSAGGFMGDSFLKNPQYLIKVSGADEVKSGYNLLISLMQNPRNRHKFKSNWFPIGFLLHRVQDLHEKLPSSVLSKATFSEIDNRNEREITMCYRLTSGTYVLIPFTKNRGQDSPFIVRIFLKSKGCTGELGTPQSSKVFLTHEDNTYESTFKKYASQGTRMNAWDLQRFLNDIFLNENLDTHGTKFPIDASRGMLAAMDYMGTGILDFENFTRLWRYLTKFKNIFSGIDTNQCGFLDLYGLQKAVNSTGIFAGNDMLHRLMFRYGDFAKRLNLVDYLCCMVRLRAFYKTFQILSSDGAGLYMSREKWIQLMMYS